MPFTLLKVEHHHFHHLDRPMAEALNKVTLQLASIAKMVSTNMIDTSKLLAAVAREKTDNDSLRALVVANTTAMATLSKQLADAIAANDPVAMQQVQTDLDKASSDLALDSDKTEAALAASVPPTQPTSGGVPPVSAPATPADPNSPAPAPMAGTGSPPQTNPS